MIPDETTIVSASYQAALFDAIVEVPNQHTLQFITSAGLHRFLPSWINLETGIVDQEKLEQNALNIVASSYVAPTKFREDYAQELKINEPQSVHDLNYMLVKEIIFISPGGKVNPFIYKLSSAHVTKQASMKTVREIYDQALETITDTQRRKYWAFVHEQILQTQQRFVDGLPVLEKVLQEEVLPLDISDRDIGSPGRLNEYRKLILANLFL